MERLGRVARPRHLAASKGSSGLRDRSMLRLKTRRARRSRPYRAQNYRRGLGTRENSSKVRYLSLRFFR